MVQDIITVITTVGFPITAYLLSFWYMKIQDEQHAKALNDKDTAAREERKEMMTLYEKQTESLSENTKAVSQCAEAVADLVKEIKG